MTTPENSRSVNQGKVSCRCGGTGVIRSESHDRDVEGNITASTLSTHPCVCRRDLPPRDGEAQWWSTETTYTHVFVTEVFQETAEIEARSEVPYDADNYRVHRHGNRYYPSSVTLSLSDDFGWLSPAEARDLAARLVEAAEVAESIDKPDAAPCGHWAPCECAETVVTTDSEVPL